jgi:hypothetical protein
MEYGIWNMEYGIWNSGREAWREWNMEWNGIAGGSVAEWNELTE